MQAATLAVVFPEQGWIVGDFVADYRITLPTGNTFRIVNGAVLDTVVGMSRSGNVEYNQVDGGTVYRPIFAGCHTQLSVLYISDGVAVLRFAFLQPTDPKLYAIWKHSALTAEARQMMAELLEKLMDAISRLVGYAVDSKLLQAPPPPKPIEDLLLWQRLFHADWQDRELAAKTGVPYSTIRNARQRQGIHKRTPRGKPRQS